MQYKIPQNVGIEDKIVGPFSLRQLIMVAGGVGVSWVLFAIMSKLYELNMIEYAVIALPGLLSVAFALVRVNDQTLLKYIMLLMEFSMKPKRRLWDHRGIASLISPDLGEIYTNEPSAMSVSIIEKSKKASNLRELSRVLDSGGFKHLQEIQHKDIDHAKDDNLVTQAYFGNNEKEKMNMYWRTIESHKKRLDFFAKLPTTQLKSGTKEAELVRQEIAKAKEAGEAARKLTISVNVRPKPTASPAPSQSAPKPQSPKSEMPKPIQPPKTIAQKPVQPPKSELPKPAQAPKTEMSKSPVSPQTQKQPEKSVAQAPQKPQPPRPVAAPNAQATQPQKKPTVALAQQAGQTPVQKPAPTAQVNGANKPNGKKQTPQPVRRTAMEGGPVRQGHVNTTNKNVPAQYVPKAPPKPQQQPPKQPPQASQAPSAEKPKVSPPKLDTNATGGEFQFEELKKGEIEINLD